MGEPTIEAALEGGVGDNISFVSLTRAARGDVEVDGPLIRFGVEGVLDGSDISCRNLSLIRSSLFRISSS